MTGPEPTPIIRNLPAPGMFISAESVERDNGRRLVLRLGANESPFGPSAATIEAMRAAAPEAALYGDPDVHDLREALGRHLDVPAECIMVTAGIDEALGMTVRAFLDRGQTGVSSLGSYPMFPYLVAGHGGLLETVPYRDDRNDLDALAAAARARGARMVYLANPDNPSGRLAELAGVRRLLDALPGDCLLVLDEAYHEFAPPEAQLPLDVEDGRLLRLRTFSKVYGLAGARVGYVLGTRETIDALERIRLHFAVGRVAQAGALAALADRDFAAGVLTAVAEGRRHFAEIGEELGVPTLPSWTNFVAFDCGTAERAREITHALFALDVNVRIPWGPPLDRCIRVTVPPEEQRMELRARLAKVL